MDVPRNLRLLVAVEYGDAEQVNLQHHQRVRSYATLESANHPFLARLFIVPEAQAARRQILHSGKLRRPSALAEIDHRGLGAKASGLNSIIEESNREHHQPESVCLPG
jgi:hypothetical protein